MIFKSICLLLIPQVITSQASLRERIAKVDVVLIHPRRAGKKMAVFDLDATLYDCKTKSQNIALDRRPGAHELLAGIYEQYDIVIWSATVSIAAPLCAGPAPPPPPHVLIDRVCLQQHWRWLEAKLTELGMLTHPGYKICCCLDKSAMFKVSREGGGGGGKGKKSKEHNVKALDFVYAKIPGTGKHNTLGIDDLSRNFAMNPDQGLQVTAFKDGPKHQDDDKELFLLAEYMMRIGTMEDFTTINHKDWRG